MLAGAIHPSMRSEKEDWQVQQLALKKARAKAQIDEEQLLRRVREDDAALFDVRPDKESIARYYLKERTEPMKEMNLWYKYHIPENKDEVEVTLQLWECPPGEEPRWIGEVADLYTVHLEVGEDKGTLAISILIPSSESRLDSRLMPKFSVFDIGCADKAMTVQPEAWFNYLMFRESDELMREEMDQRLLFHAVANKDYTGNITPMTWRNASLNDIIMTIQSMEPGNVYPRPPAHEAELSAEAIHLPEELRMTARVKNVRTNLEERFRFKNHMKNLKRKPNRMPRVIDLDVGNTSWAGTPERKRMRAEAAVSAEMARNKELKGKFLEIVSDCLNPWTEENRKSRAITEACRELLPEHQRKKLRPKAVYSTQVPTGRHPAQSPDPEPPTSPVTLRSWSGDGWISGQSTPCGSQICQLNDSIRSALSAASYVDDTARLHLPGDELKVITNETINSLVSSISGIDVLSLVGGDEDMARGNDDDVLIVDDNPEENVEPDHGMEDHDDDEGGWMSAFDDSVEIFLAKVRNESQIVTIPTDSSAGASAYEGTEDSRLMSSFVDFPLDEEESASDEGELANVPYLNGFKPGCTKHGDCQ